MKYMCLDYLGETMVQGKEICLIAVKGIALLVRAVPRNSSPRPESRRGCQLLVAMVEGYASLAKNAQDTKVWEVGTRNIVGWLKSLRAGTKSILERRTADVEEACSQVTAASLT